MFLLISIILFFLVLLAPLFVLLLWVQVRNLKRRVETLADQVAAFLPQGKKKGKKALEVSEVKPVLMESSLTYQEPDFLKVREKKEPALKKDKVQLNYQKIFANLPVWIGGVALVLAGLFMVQYSIEKGLLSPEVRLSIGGLFGLLLLLAGYWIHAKPGIANSMLISQALSGAGIAVLYICLYAGTSFYTLLSPLLGFIGMAGVTGLAVILSLKQGPPIAILGLIGGVLTPGLIESKEPQAQFLFLYLYLVLAGLFIVIRQKNWWALSIPTVFFSFAWVVLWIATSFSSHDGLWLGLFLIASCVTVVLASTKAMEQERLSPKYSYVLNGLCLGGALILMTAIAIRSHFGEIEWGLFACLTAGGLILAYYNPKLYGFVPWVSLAFNLLMLCAWTGAESTTFWSVLIFFAVLFSMGSYWLLWSSHRSVAWGLLTGISSFAYYTLAYAKDYRWFEGDFSASTDYHFWSLIALLLFAISVGCLIQILNRFDAEKEDKQKLLSIFTLMATGFLTISLMLELSQEFFRIALVAEVFTLSWLSQYVSIRIFRPLSAVLACVFGGLLVFKVGHQLFIEPRIIENLPFLISHFSEAQAVDELKNEVPTVPWVLIQFGIPVLLFATSSFLFRKEKDDRLTQSFEMGSVFLGALMAYYLIRLCFHQDEAFFLAADYIESATLTNAFFILGLACLWGGRVYLRDAVFLSGLLLAGFALFRIVFFDILIDNPFWSHEYVGKLPILNGLLLAYGLPILWLSWGSREMKGTKTAYLLPFANATLFVLVFVFISLNIRQLYQGPYLDGNVTSDVEIYTYSVAWILLGLGFLFMGTLKQNKTLRIASFAFICLSVGKVFLYDAAELEGLYRVFSFLGLGVSLLGLSWFYTRFVFQISAKDQKKKVKGTK